MNRIITASVVVASITGFGSLSANADVSGGTPPIFMMTWDASEDAVGPAEYDPGIIGSREYGTFNLGGTVNNDPNSPAFGQIMDGAARQRTGWRYQGGLTSLKWDMNWDCVVNEDPYVDATINVTNNSLNTQTFWVYMPLNIFPAILGSSTMTSYVSAVVSDNTFDNASFQATASDPVFQGYIDGNALGANAQLWQPGYALNAGFFGSNNDSSTILNAAGPAANTSIGLRLMFTLSAGDSASVTGTFEVEPVPGPAALSLLAVAGAFGSRRRRS